MFADVVMRLPGSRLLTLVISLSPLSAAPTNTNNKESQLFKKGRYVLNIIWTKLKLPVKNVMYRSSLEIVK